MADKSELLLLANKVRVQLVRSGSNGYGWVGRPVWSPYYRFIDGLIAGLTSEPPEDFSKLYTLAKKVRAQMRGSTHKPDRHSSGYYTSIKRLEEGLSEEVKDGTDEVAVIARITSLLSEAKGIESVAKDLALMHGMEIVRGKVRKYKPKTGRPRRSKKNGIWRVFQNNDSGYLTYR